MTRRYELLRVIETKRSRALYSRDKENREEGEVEKEVVHEAEKGENVGVFLGRWFGTPLTQPTQPPSWPGPVKRPS